MKKTLVLLFLLFVASSSRADDSTQDLIAAVEKGDAARVRTLLDNGVSPETKNNQSSPLLMIAASKGHPEVVRLLLDKGANPNIETAGGLTPLLAAIQEGHPDCAEILIARGADINKENSKGDFALLASARKGQIGTIKALLKKGAEINKRDRIMGRSALYTASCNGQTDAVRLLLDNKSDPDITTDRDFTVTSTSESEQTSKSYKAANGVTPLMCAVSKGHAEVVKQLIAAGADVNAKTDRGYTALLVARKKGNREIVDLLSAANAKDGLETDMVMAAQRGDVKAIESMLRNGASATARADIQLEDPNLDARDGEVMLALTPVLPQLRPFNKFLEVDRNGVARFTVNSKGEMRFASANCRGCTPLLAASSNGHSEIVKVLLEKGADPAGADPDNITPLMAAAFKGNTEVARLLLDRGAPADTGITIDGCAFTPIALATLGGYEDTVRLLVERGSRPADMSGLAFRAALGATIQKEIPDLTGRILAAVALQGSRGRLLHSAFTGNTGSVKKIIKQGAVPRRDPALSFALLLAISNGDISVARELIAGGANVDMRSITWDEEALLAEDAQAYVPLFLAVSMGNREMAQLLLDKGADPNRKIGVAKTPLTAAIRNGYSEMVKMLLDRGAIPEPSGLILSIGKPKIARMLVQKGADVNAQYSEGFTALMEAANAGDYETAMLLIENGADINAKAVYGVTVLMTAARNKGDTRVVKYLLERGLDPNVRTETGTSALDAAILDARADMASLLKKSGATSNVDAGKGTALMHAVLRGDAGTVKKLARSRKAREARIASGTLKDFNALKLAVSLGDPRIVKELLEACPPSSTDEDLELNQALNTAAKAGMGDIVDLILAAMKVQNPDSLALTSALLEATSNGRLQVVRKLIDAGVAVDTEDIYGYTPLLWASGYGHTDIVKFLIGKGAKVNRRGNDGSSALLLAASRGHMETVRVLLASGADPNVENSEGWTPLTLSVKNRQAEIARELLKAGAKDAANNLGRSAAVLARARGIALGF